MFTDHILSTRLHKLYALSLMHLPKVNLTYHLYVIDEETKAPR